MKKTLGTIFTALGLFGFALDTVLLAINNAEAARSGVAPAGTQVFGIMVVTVILSMIGFSLLYSERVSFAWFIGVGVTFILSGMGYAITNLLIAQQSFMELPFSILAITAVILLLGVTCLIYGVLNIGKK